MEFLLDNPLATMEGPFFLIFYSVVIFFSVTTLGYLKTSLDLSAALDVPSIPPKIDPFEVAYLRGGANELARTVVFALRRKGVIVIANGSKTAFLRPALGEETPRLDNIERTALDWIGHEREAKTIFSGSDRLVDRLATHIEAYQNLLETRQMLVDQATNAKLRRWKLTATCVIAGLGLYKIFVAIATGNWNIIFLLILGGLGCTAALVIGRNVRLTELGKVYLERLRSVFHQIDQPSSLSDVGSERRTAFAAVDPLLLSVGVYGAVAVVGTNYGDYNDAFRKSEKESTGGGCGGGCGSCSSTSGGSCGGGSSCGSGCGGCGGGCGS